MNTTTAPEFSGLKGRFFAWFLTSPMRRILEMKMGKPEGQIIAKLDLQGDERLLDFGCGSGFHTVLLAKELPRGAVVAVDISTEMLDRLRKNATSAGVMDRIEVLLADGLKLPLEDGSFDKAVSAAVWHHLDDPQGACNELVRVLRPGGRAVVNDLCIEGSKKAVAGFDGHDRAFGADDMKRIMAQSGLENIEIEAVGRWLVGAGDKPLVASNAG